jgi:hypothetical protein
MACQSQPTWAIEFSGAKSGQKREDWSRTLSPNIMFWTQGMLCKALVCQHQQNGMNDYQLSGSTAICFLREPIPSISILRELQSAGTLIGLSNHKNRIETVDDHLWPNCTSEGLALGSTFHSSSPIDAESSDILGTTMDDTQLGVASANTQ